MSLTIKQLEQEKSSAVWVKNTSKPVGVINMNIPDGLGGKTILCIPVTWIAFDLTTQTSKEVLIASPDFRRLVASGMLIILSEEEAEQLMKQDGANDEARRVYSNAQVATLVPTQEVEDLKAESDGTVSGFALNVVSLELEESVILNMIRGQEAVLTKHDYKYITAKSKWSKVKEFCANKLNQ